MPVPMVGVCLGDPFLLQLAGKPYVFVARTVEALLTGPLTIASAYVTGTAQALLEKRWSWELKDVGGKRSAQNQCSVLIGRLQAFRKLEWRCGSVGPAQCP